jgi:hypothetical protein
MFLANCNSLKRKGEMPAGDGRIAPRVVVFGHLSGRNDSGLGVCKAPLPQKFLRIAPKPA